MHITISRHAAERAAERGITEEGIRAIVDDVSGCAVTMHSKTDPTAIVTYDMYDGNVWAVMSNAYNKNVITVRRARKKEIEYYEKMCDDRRRTYRVF